MCLLILIKIIISVGSHSAPVRRNVYKCIHRGGTCLRNESIRRNNILKPEASVQWKTKHGRGEQTVERSTIFTSERADERTAVGLLILLRFKFENETQFTVYFMQ